MVNEELLTELNDELSRFSQTMYQVRLKTWEHVEEAYDSERLDGLLLSEVKDRLMGIVNSHINKLTQNIHGMTPKDLNAYSKEETDVLLEELLEDSTNLPYSFWGDPTKDNPEIGGLRTWSIEFPSVPAMIDGFYYKIPKTSYPIDPGNVWKIIHVWIKRTADALVYTTEITEYEENLSDENINRDGQLYIGYLTTTATGLRHFLTSKSIAIGGYKLSTFKAGGSIPVSDGLPMETDKINWV